MGLVNRIIISVKPGGILPLDREYCSCFETSYKYTCILAARTRPDANVKSLEKHKVYETNKAMKI